MSEHLLRAGPAVRFPGHCCCADAVQELVEHPFWKTKLPVLPLPAEPALEAFIQLHHLAPAQGDDTAASQVCACVLHLCSAPLGVCTCPPLPCTRTLARQRQHTCCMYPLPDC